MNSTIALFFVSCLTLCHGSIDVPPLNTASLTVHSTMLRLKTQLFSATSAATGIFSLVAQLTVYALRMFLLLLLYPRSRDPEGCFKNVKNIMRSSVHAVGTWQIVVAVQS